MIPFSYEKHLSFIQGMIRRQEFEEGLELAESYTYTYDKGGGTCIQNTVILFKDNSFIELAYRMKFDKDDTKKFIYFVDAEKTDIPHGGIIENERI